MGELEEHSLWYKYKTEVWPKESPKTFIVHNIMRVLRSIHHLGELAYISLPVTTGKLFYDKLLSTSMKKETINSCLEDSEFAKSVPRFGEIKKEVIKENYQTGLKFFEELEKRKNIPLLNPSDYSPRGEKLEQADFQALWLNIIAETTTELDMHKDWEYSNGGSEEFVHAYQLRLGIPKHNQLIFYNTKEGEKIGRERMKSIKIYDSKGEIISLNKGYSLVEKAIIWLNKNSIQSKKLENCLSLLEWTGNKIEQGFDQ